MMNSYEQTENMKIFFYNFTFEEEYTKDLKINDVERKANFEFGIFWYREIERQKQSSGGVL